MRLFVETGPLAGTEVPLDRNHPATLGSSRNCTVHITEPGVQAEHAVVKALRDEGFGIKALAPGLRLNGREVEAAALHDGDVVELGTTRLTFGSSSSPRFPHVTGFRVLGELGKGGMGVVYRAEQVSLHREVALKVLDKRRTDDPQFVARFVAEARAAAKLSHPNVVHVFDVDQDAGTYYYAMELMHHGSLEAWLKKNGRMPVERALQVVADAASGLAYAESLGIVHRDIKPDNLMLDQHGTVKIADLGLAFTEADPEEQLTGTPHFMAPEQVLRRGVDHRTDLYALGCTFYRLITGRTPFKGQTVKDILRAHVRDQAEPAHKVEPSVPVEVSTIVQRLMAKEPAERFQSADDLVEAVGELLQPPARKGKWIALAATAVLIAGAAIWWAVNKPKDVVEKTEYVNNPEAARLAVVNKELEARGREDAALIALLRARLDAGQGLDLAHALDAIIAAHPGTAAANEAQGLAATTRAAVADREAARQRARQLADEALSISRTATDAALANGDFAKAHALAGSARPAAGADAQAVADGVHALQQLVTEKARAHVQQLLAAVDTATAANDTEALTRAAATLAELARPGAWPDALLADRAAVASRAEAAAAAAKGLSDARVQAGWRGYTGFIHGPEGIDALLARADLAAAAARLDQFCQQQPAEPMASHARQLAAGLRHGERFAAAVEATIARGELQIDRGMPLTVQRWQRDPGIIVCADTSKRPHREVTIPHGELSLEEWQTLCLAVVEPADAAGSSAAFLAFLCIARHQEAARSYLASLRASDDASGTGNSGYALSSALLSGLQARLPGSEPLRLVQQELAAAQLLAQGLRALSERRNLAAANYLDRLLADHAYCLCTSALP